MKQVEYYSEDDISFEFCENGNLYSIINVYYNAKHSPRILIDQIEYSSKSNPNLEIIRWYLNEKVFPTSYLIRNDNYFTPKHLRGGYKYE